MTVLEPAQPHLGHETELWQQGFRAIAGIDEAGRGALAGPVVAGAVILPLAEFCVDGDNGARTHGVWAEVRDSKLLRPARRVALDAQIRAQAAAAAVGMASPQEIDRMGIAAATRLAMVRAVEGLTLAADFLLIDWVRLARCPLPQRSFAKADRISVSVAAASILAKVARDALMVDLGEVYPEYGFAGHKGYGAPRHLAALGATGPCPVHRYTFAPVARCASLFDGVPNSLETSGAAGAAGAAKGEGTLRDG
ncbi:MAG: ribonuclease HII [Litorilinea sp.]